VYKKYKLYPMLKLYKISYNQGYGNPIVKYIKAESQIDAINVGIPYHANGSAYNISSIQIEYLCDVEEIMNVTPACGA
jgi:hypothetical protein